jgi:hypothetical protein
MLQWNFRVRDKVHGLQRVFRAFSAKIIREEIHCTAREGIGSGTKAITAALQALTTANCIPGSTGIGRNLKTLLQ